LGWDASHANLTNKPGLCPACWDNRHLMALVDLLRAQHHKQQLGICLFEYDRQSGEIYKVLGSWEWFEDLGIPIPREITNITGITDRMVAGHSIDDRVVNDLLGRVVLVIAHNADFDRRFLERRLPSFAAKRWACSRFDIDWKAEGIR
jgi:DNA polymerase III subunit epsilon